MVSWLRFSYILQGDLKKKYLKKLWPNIKFSSEHINKLTAVFK